MCEVGVHCERETFGLFGLFVLCSEEEEWSEGEWKVPDARGLFGWNKEEGGEGWFEWEREIGVFVGVGVQDGDVSSKVCVCREAKVENCEV